MHARPPPLDISTPLLVIADKSWRALLFIVLLPLILMLFAILALGAILQNRPRR